jgi:basic amino acid/polyamine antiporter, APA family
MKAELGKVVEKPRLDRAINLTGAVVMSAGLVIGVGLFTVSTNAVGFLGPALIYGNLVALLVSLLTSLVYAELCTAWPYSGGSYAYAFESWGKYGPFAGFLTAWAILGAYFAVGAEALAFANYFLSTLDYLGWWKNVVDGQVPFATAAFLASLLILVFTYVNWRGTKEVSKTQKVLMFTMWSFMAISVVWSAVQFINFSNYSPIIPEWFNPGMFAMSATLIWWAYAGQEVIGTMAEEIKHPTFVIPRALLLVPVVVFIVTATMQWVVVGIIPDVTILQEADAPFALALQTAGVGVFAFLFFMIAVFMGNFSTVNPVLTGSSRIWFAMSRDGYLPRVLSRLSTRFRTPSVAVWFNGIMIIFLLATKGLFFLATISAFWLLAIYAFMGLTVIAARITRPEVERPFKTPLFPIIPLLVVAFCIWMMLSLPSEIIIWGALWLVFAAVIYFIWGSTGWGKKAKKDVDFFRSVETMPVKATPEELKQLNKEWKSVLIKVGVILIICVLFFAGTYIAGL